jgi:hypothetical protein
VEDPHLIAAVAAKFICRHGSKSLDAIAQHCAMARAIGDQSSLKTWRDIAAAVECLLDCSGELPGTEPGVLQFAPSPKPGIAAKLGGRSEVYERALA